MIYGPLYLVGGCWLRPSRPNLLAHINLLEVNLLPASYNPRTVNPSIQSLTLRYLETGLLDDCLGRILNFFFFDLPCTYCSVPYTCTIAVLYLIEIKSRIELTDAEYGHNIIDSHLFQHHLLVCPYLYLCMHCTCLFLCMSFCSVENLAQAEALMMLIKTWYLIYCSRLSKHSITPRLS